MERIDEVINSIDTVHKLLTRAEEPRRAIRSTSKPTKPLRARFKADFYFMDGGRAIFYSLDYVFRNGGQSLDEYEGLNKLYRLIHKYMESKDLHTVSIYANQDIHPLTDTKHYNVLVHRITPKIVRADARVIANVSGTVLIKQLKHSQVESRGK